MEATDTNSSAMESATGDAADIGMEWRDVPTVLADSVVGFVVVGNVPRVTLGQVSYRPGGITPVYRPVITLAAAAEGLKVLGQQILEIAQQIESKEAEDGEAAQ